MGVGDSCSSFSLYIYLGACFFFISIFLRIEQVEHKLIWGVYYFLHCISIITIISFREKTNPYLLNPKRYKNCDSEKCFYNLDSVDRLYISKKWIHIYCKSTLQYIMYCYRTSRPSDAYVVMCLIFH